MAIQFSDSFSSYHNIYWSSNSAYQGGATERSVMGWVNISSLATASYRIMGSQSGEDWLFGIERSDPTHFKVVLNIARSGGGNYEIRSTSAYSINTQYHVAIVATSLSAGVIYIDGSPVGSSVSVTGSGNFLSAACDLFVGGGNPFWSIPNQINGTVSSLSCHNCALSALEVSDAYASKLSIPTRRGLIFSPQLQGVAGNFTDGASITSSNTIADAASGLQGIPTLYSGTVYPIFKQDPKLTYN